MKRYAFIILAALTMFVGVASTANAQVFSSSRSSVYGGPGGYRSDRQTVFVGGGSVYTGGSSVYVGGGRGGFDISIGTPNFQFHIGDGYRYRRPPQRYYPPVRQPRWDYDYGYHRQAPPTAVVYDRFGYPVRVRLYWDGRGYYYFLDGYRYRY